MNRQYNHPNTVLAYLCALQDNICSFIESIEPVQKFSRPHVHTDRGLARPRILSNGIHIEKSAVNFTHSIGSSLPKAATDRKPEMAGRPFQAVSLSLIVHPRNPYAPTTHANLRFFIAEGDIPIWWFGGGFDLTPYYGFVEDAIHWHSTAQQACAPFGEDVYPTLKKACDEYFYLPHRKEPRGIGGLFFEDWRRGGFEQSFQFVKSVGDHFRTAYEPILRRRMHTPFTDRERSHQLYRRGRYVEFNLLYDRGTKYGLQSGRRIESVLASMPPLVAFNYDQKTLSNSPEERLYTDFLINKEWI
jgi:coproporphyrinogen III oxidase